MIPRFGQAISKIEGVMQNRQNQFKMHYFYIPTFFEGHFGGPGATPNITRRKFFLSETCSEFIFRKSQLTPII